MQVGSKVGLKDIIMISHDTSKLKIRAQKLPSPVNAPSKAAGPGEPGKLLSGAHRQHRSTQSSAKLVMRREGLACGFPTKSQDHEFSFLSLLLETDDVSGLLTYSLGDS